MEKGLQRFMKVCSKPNSLGLRYYVLSLLFPTWKDTALIFGHKNFCSAITCVFKINVVSDNGETLDFQI